MSQDLGRDVPDLKKLYAKKLWAAFSFPTAGVATLTVTVAVTSQTRLGNSACTCPGVLCHSVLKGCPSLPTPLANESWVQSEEVVGVPLEGRSGLE